MLDGKDGVVIDQAHDVRVGIGELRLFVPLRRWWEKTCPAILPPA